MISVSPPSGTYSTTTREDASPVTVTWPEPSRKLIHVVKSKKSFEFLKERVILGTVSANARGMPVADGATSAPRAIITSRASISRDVNVRLFYLFSIVLV